MNPASEPDVRKLNLATGLFLVGVVTSAWPIVRLAGLAVSDLFLIAAWILAMLSGRPPMKNPWPPTFFIATVCTVLAVLFTSVGDTTAGLIVGAKIIFLFTGLQWLIRDHVARYNGPSLILVAFCIGATSSALWAVLQALQVLPGSEGIAVNGRFGGLSGNANALGGILAVAFTMSFALLVQGHKLALLAILSCGAGLALSGSISGMLTAGVSVFLVLAFARKVLLSVVVGLAALALAPLVAPSGGLGGERFNSPLERWSQVWGREAGPSTLEIRQETLQWAWQHLDQTPLMGVGLGEADGATLGSSTLVHNWLLRAWYQGGPFLLITMLVVLLATLVALRRLWRQRRKNPFVFTAAIAWTLGTLVFAMSGPMMYERWFWMVLILPIAMTGVVSSDNGPSEHNRKITAPAGRPADRNSSGTSS